MAPSKPSYAWSEISAADQKKIPLPDRFLCRDCKRFKSPPQYSNKQLNDYRFKAYSQQRVTNITAALRCRSCTGDQTQELLCTGPCTLWKGLEDFSKNQRRRPENAWCVGCTQWKEANEPGVTPAAPPNSLLSPDEEREIAEREAGFGAYTADDIEGDADSEDEGVGFIYSKIATTSIADDAIIGSDGQRVEASGSKSSIPTLPGYLTGSKKVTNILNPSLSNPYTARSEYTDEGGKQRLETTESEHNHVEKPAKGRGQLRPGGTGWAGLDGKKKKTGVIYNAWDNVGHVHSQYRAPSQTTGLTDLVGPPSRPDAQTSSPGLTKQTPVTKHSADAPTGPELQAVPSNKTGGWAKLSTTRNPPPQFPALTRRIKQNINDGDGNDSPDEI